MDLNLLAAATTRNGCAGEASKTNHLLSPHAKFDWVTYFFSILYLGIEAEVPKNVTFTPPEYLYRTRKEESLLAVFSVDPVGICGRVPQLPRLPSDKWSTNIARKVDRQDSPDSIPFPYSLVIC